MSRRLPFRELPARRGASGGAAAAGCSGAWTLVGLFRAADRYFSDPFQLQRLEFGLWEALAQSLLASTIWAALHAGRRVARAPVPADARRAGRPDRGLLAGGVVFPIAHCVALPACVPLLMGFPLVVRDAARRAAADAPRPLPTQFVTFCRDRRRDLDAVLRPPLARARAAGVAGEDAPSFGAAGGLEDAAPPALPLQRPQQHPAAGLPGPRRGVAAPSSAWRTCCASRSRTRAAT